MMTKPLDNNAVNQKKNRLAENRQAGKTRIPKTGPSVKAKQPSCLRRKRAVLFYMRLTSLITNPLSGNAGILDRLKLKSWDGTSYSISLARNAREVFMTSTVIPSPGQRW